LLVNT